MRVTLFSLAVFLGCTAMQQQPAATPPATAAQPSATQPSATQPAGFKNLQVLPKDIPREQLLAIMRNFTRSLGVRCNHCHVVTATEPKEQLDFPSDTKEEKRVARVMLRMTMNLNNEWMARVEAAEHPEVANPAPPAEPRIVCWTCHRGRPEPEAPPAPTPTDAK